MNALPSRGGFSSDPVETRVSRRRFALDVALLPARLGEQSGVVGPVRVGAWMRGGHLVERIGQLGFPGLGPARVRHWWLLFGH
jgi:hypothetical protein